MRENPRMVGGLNRVRAPLVVAAVAVMVLVACSSYESATPAATSKPPPAPASTLTTAPSGPIGGCPAFEQWNEASSHVGEYAKVKGPVASTDYAVTSNGSPTFLNVGNPYPNPDRFVVLIWGENRDNFPVAPEAAYEGKLICVSGTISDYQGVPEIEVSTPDQIQEAAS
jgi:hypothetical protein